MTTHAERFPVESANCPHQLPDDTDLYTAKQWTLHLRIPDVDDTPSLQAVQDVVDFLLAANDPALTGEYCGGDSFAEWCEPYSGQSWYAAHGRALHLYFHAPDLPAAILVGQRISALVHRDSPRNSINTTGGDWAEYAEIWQPEHR